jgi:hypothetical protein
MPLQGYKPQQIKSKHLFSCICLEEEEEKKKKKKKNNKLKKEDRFAQPQQSGNNTLKN